MTLSALAMARRCCHLRAKTGNQKPNNLMLTFEENDVNPPTVTDYAPTEAPQVGCSTDQDITPLPAPCAWCEAEAGERTNGSHTVCARHGCMELLRFNVAPETVRAWAMKQPNGEAGFHAAMQLLAQEVAA